ncbi:MAG TPA: hypothetical protein VHZ73_08370 [Vicinamibacterales bacterium]|jgi:hypothetical protein|nr:hypothetical protein [Vicinamibacterales bacterium]
MNANLVGGVCVKCTAPVRRHFSAAGRFIGCPPEALLDAVPSVLVAALLASLESRSAAPAPPPAPVALLAPVPGLYLAFSTTGRSSTPQKVTR